MAHRPTPTSAPELTCGSSSPVFVPISLPGKVHPASAHNLNARTMAAVPPMPESSGLRLDRGAEMAAVPPMPASSGPRLDRGAEMATPFLTTQGLRLRIETLEAQKKEALQRVVDLQRMSDSATWSLHMPPEAETVEIGRAAALEAATQELLSIKQKQNELEIAFAKASARENLESQLQTACGGCLHYKQKVIAQRAEEDHQFEALRAEMAASAADLEVGKREAHAAAVADASRHEAEEARARLVQAQTAELEELQCRARNTKDALKVLGQRAAELTSQNRVLVTAQQDLNQKISKCWGGMREGLLRPYHDTAAVVDS